MKQELIYNGGNDRLLLFFAGWGADESLFHRPAAAGYDYMLCYDYTESGFDASLLKPYRSIRLLAWSMGVWMAEQTLAPLSLPWEKRIAINGTPHPKDDSRGIPTEVFEGTLKFLNDQTLRKFRRRMCGSNEELNRFLEREPQRSTDSLKQELDALNRRIDAHPEEVEFSWDLALIGNQDAIFSPANQQNAWKDQTHLALIEAAHYNDGLFTDCLLGKEEEWIKP